MTTAPGPRDAGAATPPHPSPPRNDGPRVRRRPPGHGGLDGRGRTAALVLVPVTGGVAVAVAAAVASTLVTLVVALVALGAVAVALAVALALTVRAHHEAERSVGSLLAALEAAATRRCRTRSRVCSTAAAWSSSGTRCWSPRAAPGAAVRARVHRRGHPGRAARRRQPDGRGGPRRARGRVGRGRHRAARGDPHVRRRRPRGGGPVRGPGPGAGLHAQELERRIRVGLAQSRLAGGGERAPRLAVEAGAAVLAPWDEGGVSDLLVRAEQALAQRRALRRSVPQQVGPSPQRPRRPQRARPERPGA